MVKLYISGCQQLSCKLGKHVKSCRQQKDVVQHLAARERKQDTLIPTATKSLSDQCLAKSLNVAAQNQLKNIS